VATDTERDHRSRAARMVENIGTVRLVDLDPLRVDAWLPQMRRRGVGAGAIRGRVATLKAAASWGVSRRILRSNPVVDAPPRVRNGRRSVHGRSDRTQTRSWLDIPTQSIAVASSATTRSGAARCATPNTVVAKRSPSKRSVRMLKCWIRVSMSVE
jgi:site-specific recombinase XerC